MKHIQVAVGIIKNAQGEVLLSQRAEDKDYPRQWEFPGGKLEAGESEIQALERELYEELGIKIEAACKLINLQHQYNNLHVRLWVYEISKYSNTPKSQEGQKLKWALPAYLHKENILAGNRPIIKALNLPNCYMITPAGKSPHQLATMIRKAKYKYNIKLLQYRDRHISQSQYTKKAIYLIEFAKDENLQLLLNCSLSMALDLGAAGAHLNSKNLLNLNQRPQNKNFMVAASCHDHKEVLKANDLAVDFAVLSPILQSQSHPGHRGIGWDRFAEIVADSRVPTYALGGVGFNDIIKAKSFGAQGIAGISCFIPS